MDDVQDSLSEQQMLDENDQQLLDDENEVDNMPSEITTKSAEMKIAAQFLLKTQEFRKVSQASLLGLIEDIDEIFQSKVDTIERKVMSHLSSAGNTNDDSLKEIFNTERTTIFSVLKSSHHQE